MVVVIPARNEEATIGVVVKHTCEYGAVIVVDDASTDRTGPQARRAGAKVITNVTRRHIAATTVAGMRVALSMNEERIVTMDAGGSHNPHDVWALCEPTADLVIGSRQRYRAPWRRRLLSWLGSECVNLAMQTCASRVRDCTSGFRCYSRRAATLLCEADILSYSYDWQIEALARVRDAGMSVEEVPIDYKFTNSHLRARDAWLAIKMCSKIYRGKL